MRKLFGMKAPLFLQIVGPILPVKENCRKNMARAGGAGSLLYSQLTMQSVRDQDVVR